MRQRGHQRHTPLATMCAAHWQVCHQALARPQSAACRAQSAGALAAQRAKKMEREGIQMLSDPCERSALPGLIQQARPFYNISKIRYLHCNPTRTFAQEPEIG